MVYCQILDLDILVVIDVYVRICVVPLLWAYHFYNTNCADTGTEMQFH